MLSPTHPMQLALGLTVWAVWFVAWYGGMSVGCAVAEPDEARGAFTWINLALLVISLLVAVLLLYWARRSWQVSKDETLSRAERLITWVGAGGHCAAGFSTIAMTLPALVIPPCV